MTEDAEKEKMGVEIRIAPGADDGTKAKVQQLASIFEGPLFAKLVRDAVEEMILEGKLTYDLQTDEFDIPEDIVKRWASDKEKNVWSKKKKT